MEGKRISATDIEGRHWMVIYTKSKCEKKTDQLLRLQGIQSFCPLVREKKKWADRYKMVEFPLFNSYVFVYVNRFEQLRVLQTAGVVNFVYYCGKPATVPQGDIDRVRLYTEHYADLEVLSIRGLRPGDLVKINDGILFDIHGEILEVHGKSVLVILKQLDCALIAKLKVSSDHILVTKAIVGDYSAIN